MPRALRPAAVAVIAAALACSPAIAQGGSPGCMEDEQRRQFDFWVGSWNVYAASGAFGGENTIERDAAGCVLQETWRSASGSGGRSLNFVDPNTGAWRQLWTGVNHVIDYSGGLNARGQMILEGEITYFGPDGTRSAPFRGAWTPRPDGAVIQHFQQYDATARAWSDWALLTYVPDAADPNGREPGADATGPVIELAPDAFTADAGAPG